ncbi:MAG: PQQ-binding-like beta-propeller repeat protein [Spirochaetales bacterium]|nr:PQQ-binding-like beta-propeller repeat protein [Spirochaetales bacterium]MCF7937532.1 PQQ-binding-like beta-propeller repeat protein [Spirochaetales bacterium]
MRKKVGGSIIFIVAVLAALALFYSCSEEVVETEKPETETAEEREAEVKDEAEEPAKDLPEVRRKALLTFLTGTVEVDTGDGKRSAGIGDLLDAGARVSTGSLSSCELQFDKTAVVRLDENTTVSIRAIAPEVGQRQIELENHAGSVVSRVNKLVGNETFEVRTKTVACGVRGTEFLLSEMPGKETVLAVKAGSVSVVPNELTDKSLKNALSQMNAEKEAAEKLNRAVQEAAPVVSGGNELVIPAAISDHIQKRTEEFLVNLEESSVVFTAAEDLQRQQEEIDNVKQRVKRIFTDTAPAVMDRKKSKAMEESRPFKFIELPEKKGEEPVYLPVHIKVIPESASIELNKEKAGTGNFSGLFTVGETIEIRAQADGYLDKQIRLEVLPEKKRTIEITLEQETARASSVEGGKEKPVFEEPEVAGRFSASTGALVRSLTVSSEKIITADRYGVVSAFTRDGSLSWTVATANSPNENNAVKASGNRVFFSGVNEFLVVDSRNGSVIKQEKPPSEKRHPFGRRIVRAEAGFLYPANDALDILDSAGRLISSIPIPGGSRMTPGVSGNIAYIVDQDGNFHQIDLQNAIIERSLSTSAIQPTATNVELAGNTAYFVGKNGTVVSIDLSAWKVNWEKPLVSDRRVTVMQDLQAADGGLFAYANGMIYGLSASGGTPLFEPISGVTTEPFISSGKLFSGTIDEGLAVFDAATGEKLDNLFIDEIVSTRPLLIDGLLFVGSRNGKVHIINPGSWIK